MYSNDSRTVITLDAGGTNFIFSAIQGNKKIVEDIRKSPFPDNLELCINSITEGFREAIFKLGTYPVAISFAFPGPADYPNGIIGGNITNFPCFKEGFALANYLENEFNIPVFINNDADLFVYGEALAGFLPEINNKLKKAGSEKQYKNLTGFTWGTGFGIGITFNKNMHIGDNSCSEIFCLPSAENPQYIVEEFVSIRGIKRIYGELSKNTTHNLDVIDIFNIAEKKRDGDRVAAIQAFASFGKAAGEAIATVLTIIDGLVVIGGGISHNMKYIMPSLKETFEKKLMQFSGNQINRLPVKIYNLDDDNEFDIFAKGNAKKIKVYNSNEYVAFDSEKKLGIGVSKIGTSHAVALGAYAYALNILEKK